MVSKSYLGMKLFHRTLASWPVQCKSVHRILEEDCCTLFQVFLCPSHK